MSEPLATLTTPEFLLQVENQGAELASWYDRLGWTEAAEQQRTNAAATRRLRLELEAKS